MLLQLAQQSLTAIVTLAVVVEAVVVSLEGEVGDGQQLLVPTCGLDAVRQSAQARAGPARETCANFIANQRYLDACNS